jgi:hypothetical protein
MTLHAEPRAHTHPGAWAAEAAAAPAAPWRVAQSAHACVRAAFSTTAACVQRAHTEACTAYGLHRHIPPQLPATCRAARRVLTGHQARQAQQQDSGLHVGACTRAAAHAAHTASRGANGHEIVSTGACCAPQTLLRDCRRPQHIALHMSAPRGRRWSSGRVFAVALHCWAALAPRTKTCRIKTLECRPIMCSSRTAGALLASPISFALCSSTRSNGATECEWSVLDHTGTLANMLGPARHAACPA